MLLVVGLGNPGKEYAQNRHNAGFMAIDEIAKDARAEAFREKFSAEWARCEIAGEPVVLLKPMTYMNESGRSVQPATAFFKIAPKDVVVLHDELDVPFRELRLKFGGGHAGHNGLRSIIGSFGSPDFARVRIGIGQPPPGFRGDTASYVLANFDTAERAELPDVIKRTSSAVKSIVERGFTSAMNALNTRPKAAKAPKKPSGSPPEEA